MFKTAKRFAHRTSLCALLAIASLTLPGSIGCHPSYEARDPGPLVPGEVDRLVDILAKLNRYTSRAISVGGEESPEWRAYRRLLKYLDRQTALVLLHHPTPSVRVWISLIVLDRFPADRESVFPLMHDKSLVHTMEGCTFGADTVAGLVFGVKTDIDRRILEKFYFEEVGPDGLPR